MLEPDRDQIELFVDARIEQAPSANSRLTLSQRPDEFGAPMLRMDWRKTELDKHTLRSVLLRARRISGIGCSRTPIFSGWPF